MIRFGMSYVSISEFQWFCDDFMGLYHVSPEVPVKSFLVFYLGLRKVTFWMSYCYIRDSPGFGERFPMILLLASYDSSIGSLCFCNGPQ